MNGVRIKSIEIEGFKSFPDRVLLKIPTGITAIVGPNGCGKSNIFDAIKWCFGDHSPRSLRIKNSEDVLFVGTETRKPAHTCEVTITFEGEFIKDRFKTDEVKITRRYYRTGETEYLMNGEDVRLKDIQDFLLEMGVGAKSVAIVGQGEVVNIATGKPEDLRFYIDEATGIMKYKLRYHEAMKKLDLTKSHLERVEDVIKEVRRQIKAIDRHAKKAEKAKRLKEELREAELILYSYKYHNYNVKLESLKESLNFMNSRIEELRKLIKEKEDDLYKINGEIERLEESIGEKNREFELMKEKREKILSEIHRLEIECRGLEENMASCRKEAGELNGIIEKIVKREEELFNRREIFLKELELRQKDISHLNENLGVLKEKLENLRLDIKRKRELLFELSSEESKKRSEAVEKERETEFLERNLEKLRKEREELIKEHQNKIELISKLESQLNYKEVELDERREELHALNVEIDELRKKRGELQKEKENLIAEKESLLAKLRALEMAIREGKFYTEGTRKILERNSDFRDRILNRCIEVKSGFEKAVEGVLREKKESILTERMEEIIDGIKFLKSEGNGRASFTLISAIENCEPFVEKVDGIVARGDEVIIPKNDLGTALVRFFKRVLIIRSIDDYMELKNAIPDGMIVATLDGDVIESAHFYGGAPEEGIISKEGELMEMKREVGTMELKIASLNSSIKTVEDEIANKEEVFLSLRRDIEILEGEMRRMKVELENYRIEEKRLRENLEIVEEELKEVEELIEKGVHLRNAINARIDELNRRIRLLEEDIRAMTDEEAQLSSRIEVLSGEWQEKRIETSDIENKLRGVEEEIGRLEEEKANIEERKLYLLGTSWKGAFDYYRFYLRLNLLRKELDDIDRILNEIRSSAQKEVDLLHSLKKGSEEVHFEITTLREELEKLVERRGEVSSQMKEVETTVQFLKNEIMEKYNLSIDEFEKPDIDPSQYEERVKKLREEYSSLGEVAFYTIEEYEELSQRYEFLNSQKEDLIKAVEDVNELINRINIEAKAVFETTFERIKQRFSELISHLMNEAQGNLFLSNPDDMFESGVEITIQPKGKRLKHLHLLSGGEKAIVAIAFIFSLLEARDIPFIFLDEIDAPLDDVNVRRFNSLIRKVSRDRQIVLITHNKITMESADALYGVSMEEPGVSKILSVALV